MMQVDPDFTAFAKTYDAGAPQVVWTSLVADLDTPVSVMLKLAHGQPYSFLFESVEGGATRGRYSFIGMKPDLIWRCYGERAEINRKARTDQNAWEPCAEGALESLRRLVREMRVDLPASLPPMATGLFGYMGYDMVRLMEKLPSPNPDPLGLADSIFIRPSIMVIFDSVKDILSVVTPVWPQNGVSARAAYNQANERLNDVVTDFEKPLPHGANYRLDSLTPLPEPQSNTTRAEYHAMVARAKEYIAAGDIFQVVPSQRFRMPFELPPFALYRALRRINPSPYMNFLDFGDFAIVGSSPELLVRLRDDVVTIRPIAGSRPRGATPEQDAVMAHDLITDEKERAEHLMLLDLGRNDVGRVSQTGSVRVTGQFMTEYYSHIIHLVSNVEGLIDPEFDAITALCAGFPAGTVSGAPKIRAMEIIDELEKEKRGVYAGCVGYFSANGSMDNCIALRTAVVKDKVVYIQAGGGVVADSDPEAEYQETITKAKAMVRAAEEAVRFASAASKGQ